MKMWVDAKRQPEVSWVWVKTAHCATVLIEGGCVELISFAPDQPDLVDPITEWLAGSGLSIRQAVHLPNAGAKNPPPLLRTFPRQAG